MADPTPPEPPRTRPGWLASGAGLAGVVLGAAAVMIGQTQRPGPSGPAVPTVVPLAVAPAAPTLVEAIATTRSSVVSLRTPSRAGAGVIIDPRGFVVTNMHVVGDVLATDAPEGAAVLRARFADGRELAATVVVADKVEDLAVLRLVGAPDESFTAAQMGRSSELVAGTAVFAVGNPLGLSHSVSAGIVSAIDRAGVAGNAVPLIQLDASINVGNSGGPLFTDDGALVGLVIARDQQAEGIAFALPIDHVRGFLTAVTDEGAPRAAALGITLGLDRALPEPVRALGYGAGLPVAAVLEGGAAAAAGIRAGDVIVEARGERLDANPDAAAPSALGQVFAQAVRAMFPGERIDLVLVRDGALVRLEVEAGAASDAEQTFIDAELALGVRLDRGASVPTVAEAIAARGLGRYGARVRGGVILGLLGRETPDRESLGKVLAELRVVMRSGERDLMAWVRLRDPQGGEALWPISLE